MSTASVDCDGGCEGRLGRGGGGGSSSGSSGSGSSSGGSRFWLGWWRGGDVDVTAGGDGVGGDSGGGDECEGKRDGVVAVLMVLVEAG